MFENIGGKIKKFAQIMCWIGMGASALAGVLLLFGPAWWLGIIIAVVGCFVSWIGSFLLFGFGQLIEDTSAIRRTLSNDGVQATNASPSPLSGQSSVGSVNAKAVNGWVCTCGWVNENSQTYCFRCRRNRSAAKKKVICKHCGASNNETNELCFACNKPVNGGTTNESDGVTLEKKPRQLPTNWTCECGKVNDFSMTACPECGRYRPKITCKQCGAKNSVVNEVCFSCGAQLE